MIRVKAEDGAVKCASPREIAEVRQAKDFKLFEHTSGRNTVAAATGKMVWVGRGISCLLGLAFGLSAFMKLWGGTEVTQGMAHLGLPESLTMPLAMVEVSCVLIYLIPATSVLGAILLTGYMGGAIYTHLRVGDPFVLQIALGIFVWLGLYLRDPRLRALIPIRTN